jgi:hypothetical protein
MDTPAVRVASPITVFARGNDQRLWSTIDTGAQWSGWCDSGRDSAADAIAGAPAITYLSGTETVIFARRASTGELYWKQR